MLQEQFEVVLSAAMQDIRWRTRKVILTCRAFEKVEPLRQHERLIWDFVQKVLNSGFGVRLVILGRGEVACTGLTKIYEGSGGRKALDSVTFTTASHGIFSLIGMNGAGKTTLVRILATQLALTSGSASIDGLDVMKDTKRLRERIAIIPQEARTIPWMTPSQSVYSYLLWRGEERGPAKRKAAESLAKVGIGEFASMPNRKLSGGQRRKVMVAAVLAADAEVTFLDEPTTGLDPISRKELWNSLEVISRDRFLVLTTHYLEEAESLANNIAVLDKGRLLGMGDMDSLRRLVRFQFSIRIPPGQKAPRSEEGNVTAGKNGETQILTNEDEARRLSGQLLADGISFSVNRTTLDDVFFHLVQESGATKDE